MWEGWRRQKTCTESVLTNDDGFPKIWSMTRANSGCAKTCIALQVHKCTSLWIIVKHNESARQLVSSGACCWMLGDKPENRWLSKPLPWPFADLGQIQTDQCHNLCSWSLHMTDIWLSHYKCCQGSTLARACQAGTSDKSRMALGQCGKALHICQLQAAAGTWSTARSTRLIDWHMSTWKWTVLSDTLFPAFGKSCHLWPVPKQATRTFMSHWTLPALCVLTHPRTSKPTSDRQPGENSRQISDVQSTDHHSQQRQMQLTEVDFPIRCYNVQTKEQKKDKCNSQK